MRHECIERELSDLLQRIEQSDERISLQPKLHQVIIEMDRRHHTVPTEARRLEARLRDEAIEAQFDNLPV